MTRPKNGFTLIELLIVISIIGILAVIFVPSLFNAPKNARDTQRVEMVNKLGGILLLEHIDGKLGNTASGCIENNPAFFANPKHISSYIKNNIEKFNGIFPTDKAVQTKTAIQCTNNGYTFYNIEKDGNGWNKAVWGNSSTIFAIWIPVENPENGNFDLNKANWIRVMGQKTTIKLSTKGNHYMYVYSKHTSN